MDAKSTKKTKFRAAVMANPQWKAAYGGAWERSPRPRRKARPRSRSSSSTAWTRSWRTLRSNIVQYVAEMKKPDGERLAGYHEAQLESLRLQLFSPAPIYPRHGDARIAGALELDLAEAGPQRSILKWC